MARIPYICPEQLPENYARLNEEEDDLYTSIDSDYWNQAKTVQALANNPELAKLHVRANVSLWEKSKLSPAEVELVILSVARAIDSPFEWHAHSIIAIERTGISRDTVLAIAKYKTKKLNKKDEALIKYVFEFVREVGSVSDSTHDRLSEYYANDSIVGINMLSGYYILLHYITNSLDIHHDDEFVGWELQNFPAAHERYS